MMIELIDKSRWQLVARSDDSTETYVSIAPSWSSDIAIAAPDEIEAQVIKAKEYGLQTILQSADQNDVVKSAVIRRAIDLVLNPSPDLILALEIILAAENDQIMESARYDYVSGHGKRHLIRIDDPDQVKDFARDFYDLWKTVHKARKTVSAKKGSATLDDLIETKQVTRKTNK